MKTQFMILAGKWRNVAMLISALVVGIVIAFCCLIYVGRGIFYIPDRCEASAEARKIILKKLNPEEALTLRSVSTLADEDSSCSLTFLYIKNGKTVEVSAVVDAIHGLEISWDRPK